ncbi:hypothetical protein KA005_59115 [bacterium]|nr:hypothetical protein [bacterium]
MALLRKYRDLGKLPSELEAERIRTWRTREDPFKEVWEMVRVVEIEIQMGQL